MRAQAEVQVGRSARWMDRAGIGLAILLIAVIWGLIWVSIGGHFREATERARHASVTLARSLEAEVAGRLRTIETILRLGAAMHARDPEGFTLQGWVGSTPDIARAALIGPDGIVRLEQDGQTPWPPDLRDQPPVAAILADPSRDRLEIGPPLAGPNGSGRSIAFAWPLRDAAGGFAGVLLVTVDSDSFSRLYRRLDLQGGSIGLIGHDGIIRARVPGAESLVGTRLPAAAMAHIHTKESETHWRGHSAVDGIDRFVLYRPVQGYPLIVAIGTAADVALAIPRRKRIELLATGSFLTLLVLSLCLGVALLRRRDLRARTQLEAVIAHVGQGIIMIDPKRRLAVVNRQATEMLGLPPGLAVPGAPIDAIIAWQEQAGEFGGPASHVHVDSFGAPGGAPVVTRRTRPDGTWLEIRTAHAADGSHVRSFTDITAAQRSAAAIADARDRALAAEAALVAALEHAPHGVLLAGPDDQVLFCNQAAIDLIGIPADLARPGTPITRLVAHQAASGEIAPLVRPVAEAWAKMRAEALAGIGYQRVKPDGRVIEVRSSFLADGRFIRTYTDVTAHHAALAAQEAARDQAQAAQAALAAALENVPHGVLVIGADRRVQTINAIAAELLDLPPALARPGVAMRDIVTLQLERGDFAETPMIAAVARAGLDGPQTPMADYERRRQDGRVVEVRTTHLQDGRIIRTFTDVTARHLALKAEAAARDQAEASRSALVAAFENAPLGIALFDAAGRIEVANSLSGELVGLPPDLLRPGTDIRSIVRAQIARGDFAAQPDLLQLATASQEYGMLEHPPYIRTTPQGRVLEVRVRFLADGRSLRTLTDVTAQHQALRAQETARLAAEAALRSRTEFLAIVSHELRTPLHVVIGLAELLLQQQPRPDQVPDLQVMRDSGQRLLGLVDDILDVSRLERGRVTLQEAAFDPRGTLGAMAGLIAPRAQAKGLAFRQEFDPGLPRTALGDEERLRQVLLKLLDNAVKFTPSGCITLSAAAEPMAPAGAMAGDWRLVITIADTGIGITPEAAARLFEPFAQGDSSTARPFGGLGLGLAVCRLLLESMGGSIAVESKAGAGSAFRVELPLRRPPQELAGDPGHATHGRADPEADGSG